MLRCASTSAELYTEPMCEESYALRVFEDELDPGMFYREDLVAPPGARTHWASTEDQVEQSVHNLAVRAPSGKWPSPFAEPDETVERREGAGVSIEDVELAEFHALDAAAEALDSGEVLGLPIGPNARPLPPARPPPVPALMAQRAREVLRPVLHSFFWSSTGSPSHLERETRERVVLELRGAFCRVDGVAFGVYRARYQFGSPVYPPRAVTINLTTSPLALHEMEYQDDARSSWQACENLPCKLSDAPQFISTTHAHASKGLAQRGCVMAPAIPAPIASHVSLTFRGKPQSQFDDRGHYLAIASVSALGTRASAAGVHAARLALLDGRASCTALRLQPKSPSATSGAHVAMLTSYCPSKLMML